MRVLSLLHIINCCKLSLYAISNLQKRDNWPQFGPPIFFFKNMVLSVARYHGQLSLDIMAHHVQDQKELMIQSWENLTDRRRDGQADESDFKGRCSNKVERPKTITVSCNNIVFDLFICKFSQIRINDSRQYSQLYKSCSAKSWIMPIYETNTIWFILD